METDENQPKMEMTTDIPPGITTPNSVETRRGTLKFSPEATSVSMPLLVVLVLWLTAIFISFGLFAPFNATVVSSLFVSALSVSGAIFLILEMYTPYTGLIQLSNAPLRTALAHFGQ